MKILISGSGGQLGMELMSIFAVGKTAPGLLPTALKDATVMGFDLNTLDISDLSETKKYVLEQSPDIIINTAAFTDVNRCEQDIGVAFQANAIGARNMAIAADAVGAKLIHLSTDYVFPGNRAIPYNEWDTCGPQSVYGATKLLGEQYVRDFSRKYFIVRTAWLYGYYGGNFVKTILKAGKERGKLSVVDDQRGNPTNAADLAHHLAKIAATEEYGIYHCTGNGECSWYEFAREIIALSGIECEVVPCTTDEYPTPAKRPAYSSLDNRMLRHTVGDEMRNWHDAIAEYMMHYDKKIGAIKI